MTVRSKKIRAAARGESCTMRLPGCLWDGETVVLAHLPVGMKGVGMKSPDYCAVFACHNCHTQIDGADRWNIHAKDYLRAWAETLISLESKGVIEVK